MVETTLTERTLSYGGDVAPQEAWHAISTDKDAVLIDVRTKPEWMFVGVPDLSRAGKQPVLVEWQSFPSMGQNPSFADQVRQAGVDPSKKLYFLCRVGGRSKAAAMAMTALGFGACFNILGGFEGDLDGDRHRGAASGWKAAGLPWMQS